MYKGILLGLIVLVGFFSLHIINLFMKEKQLKISMKNYVILFSIIVVVVVIVFSIVEENIKILLVGILPLFLAYMGLTNTSNMFVINKQNLDYNKKSSTKEKTSKFTLKFLFKEDKFYRLFIVLQILFIIIVMIYDIQSSWNTIDIVDNFGRSRYFWGNTLFISTFILPIFISKSLDWILEKRRL